MVRPTWEDRDLPVLRAVVQHIEESGSEVVSPDVIEQLTGFDPETVQMALAALDGGQPPFFRKVHSQGSGEIYAIQGLMEKARRAVGLWPTAEEFADRLVAALDRAEAEAASDEQRGAIRRAREAIGRLGRDLLVEVAARIITGPQ